MIHHFVMSGGNTTPPKDWPHERVVGETSGHLLPRVGDTLVASSEERTYKVYRVTFNYATNRVFVYVEPERNEVYA